MEDNLALTTNDHLEILEDYIKVMEDDLEVMEDDLGVMEDNNLEMMEDNVAVIEVDLGVQANPVQVLCMKKENNHCASFLASLTTQLSLFVNGGTNKKCY